MDYLDLSWEFEIADCELVLRDSNTNKQRPFGVVKISTFNRQALTKQFEQLEGDLISTKMLLATTEANTDGLRAELNEMRAQVAKAKQEAENSMMQLIEAKMALAEQQGQNDELSRKLRTLSPK
jgi:chromosome segregation ATPase